MYVVGVLVGHEQRQRCAPLAKGTCIRAEAILDSERFVPSAAVTRKLCEADASDWHDSPGFNGAAVV